MKLRKSLLSAILIASIALRGAAAIGELHADGYKTVRVNDPRVTHALDAKDLAGAQKLVGKQASFRGAVARVYSSKDGKMTALDFDRDYSNAMVAVAFGDNAKGLPQPNGLVGKQVLVSGTISLYRSKPEIVLNSPNQILLISVSQ